MAGYCSHGSPRSASMSGGTASGEPIWPRLVAAAWRTFTSGSRERVDEGGDGAPLPRRPEHDGREVADLLVGVVQQARGAPARRRRRAGRRSPSRRCAWPALSPSRSAASSAGRSALGRERRRARSAAAWRTGQLSSPTARSSGVIASGRPEPPELRDRAPPHRLLAPSAGPRAAGFEGHRSGGLTAPGRPTRAGQVLGLLGEVARWPSTSPPPCARLSRAISEMFSIAFTTSSPPFFCSAVACETCWVMPFMLLDGVDDLAAALGLLLGGDADLRRDLVHVLDGEAHLAAAGGLLLAWSRRPGT